VTKAIIWPRPAAKARPLRIFYDRAVHPPDIWVIVCEDERFYAAEVVITVPCRTVYDPAGAPPGQLEMTGVVEISDLPGL